MRYPCSKNKSGKINFKFAIFVIYILLNCGIYQQIEKNSGFYMMYCFLKSLIVIRRYHHFTQRAVNHCCQSLKGDYIRLKQKCIRKSISLLLLHCYCWRTTLLIIIHGNNNSVILNEEAQRRLYERFLWQGL